MTTVQAILLAIIEGITEFLPVSSTGHMILASAVMKVQDPEFAKTFEIVIQLGAIMAVAALYIKRFFVSFDIYLKLIAAFIPTGVIGLLAARLSEKYARPAIVMEERAHTLVGSCRSIASVNIVDALRSAKDFLTHFGGHAAAAGFELKKEKASLLFCYDTPAFIAGCIAKIFLPTIPLFYHQNETVLFGEISRTTPFYWAKCLEVVFIRFVKCLSFPEPNRAKYFLEDVKLKKDVIIVENCPKKFSQIPECAQKIRELKMKGYKVVLHRGPIGKGDSIDIHETVHSIKYWPSNTMFVNIGIYTKEEEKLCMKIGLEEGLENRIMFIPFIGNQEEMFKHIACADVGLVLYKPITINRKYVAPVKLYDYFACGVPVIVPKSLPYISDMVKSLRVGLSYLESTPEAIGKTVRELLEHPDRELMARRARAEHLSRLNFETQFQPILKKIQSVVNEKN